MLKVIDPFEVEAGKEKVTLSHLWFANAENFIWSLEDDRITGE